MIWGWAALGLPDPPEADELTPEFGVTGVALALTALLVWSGIGWVARRAYRLVR